MWAPAPAGLLFSVCGRIVYVAGMAQAGKTFMCLPCIFIRHQYGLHQEKSCSQFINDSLNQLSPSRQGISLTCNYMVTCGGAKVS